MRKDFCKAKYRTASSASDFLARGSVKKDFCEAKDDSFSSMGSTIRPQGNAREQSSRWFFGNEEDMDYYGYGGENGIKFFTL
jgi:hypothetical protein